MSTATPLVDDDADDVLTPCRIGVDLISGGAALVVGDEFIALDVRQALSLSAQLLEAAMVAHDAIVDARKIN